MLQMPRPVYVVSRDVASHCHNGVAVSQNCLNYFHKLKRFLEPVCRANNACIAGLEQMPYGPLICSWSLVRQSPETFIVTSSILWIIV